MITAMNRTARRIRQALVLGAVTTALSASAASAFPEDILGDPETHWVYEILQVLTNLGDGDGSYGIDAPDDGDTDVLGGGGAGSGSDGPEDSKPNVVR